MSKEKIPSLVYNAMFKAVFNNNKNVLFKMIESILEYCQLKIDIKDKELILRNNELPLENYQDKQLICDYIIKLNDHADLNIEINKASYAGLVERNLTYSFKIYYEHFKSGDNYKEFDKYSLLQVNFNNYPNPNGKNINRFFMIDIEDITNSLSRNLCIINIDIASCYHLVYNNTNLKEVSRLERYAGIIYSEYLEDISVILGSDLLTMKEKKDFLESIKEISKDKDVQEGISFEKSLDYRFDLVHRTAFEQGIEQGLEQGIHQTITSMLKKQIDIETIAEITNKTVDEIKEIEQSIKD